MKKETLDRIKQFAMGIFLSSWKNKEYDDVLDTLENGETDDILIWEPLENESPEEIAFQIQMVKDGIEKIIERETK